MRRNADLANGSALAAGWRVLRRHLRYAAADPRKLLWIARRAWQICRNGELQGVLQRHRLLEDFYRDYPSWAQLDDQRAFERSGHYEARVAAWPARPSFSVLMPVYAPELSLLEACMQSVLDQTYGEWQLCIVDDHSPTTAHMPRLEALAAREPRVHLATLPRNSGIAAATNHALAVATGDFCVFLDQDDVLAKHALVELAVRANDVPHADLMYADEDRIDLAGARSRPFFEPDWDPEWLRATNYVLHPVAIRTSLLRALGGLREGLDGVQDWDLLLRIAEAGGQYTIEHIPRVLYHWREHAGSTAAGIYEKEGIVARQQRALSQSIERRGEQAQIETTTGGFRIAYRLPAEPPLVSIVIPTRDHPALLRRCLDALRHKTDYPNWQTLLVDNGSTDAAALQLIREAGRDRRFTVLHDARAFNYSALCNEGVAAANGEVVVLLNNDVEPIAADWLRELVAHALRPGIGLVAALLYYPNRTIQHAGVILGLNGVADRPYIGYPQGFRGVDGRLGVVHTITAMITACAAVRRETYLRAGGMDEALPVACNDLDLCLRVRGLGLRNILTPFAQAWHAESATRGYHYDTQHARQEARDEERFRSRYAALLECDPAYNLNLTLDGPAYALAKNERVTASHGTRVGTLP